MKLPFVTRLVTMRRLLKDLHRIADAKESIARSLQRLADRFAPEAIDQPEEQIRQHSAVSYSRDEEQAKILDFVTRLERDLGREPTEQEIVDHLDGVMIVGDRTGS